MAKAVALIAFALGVLAIAGSVQGYVDNSGKFIKQDKFDVDYRNKSSVESILEVVCATCKLNSKTDFKALRQPELEIRCRNRKNGKVTYVQPILADDGGFFKTYVENGHRDDLCMVRVVTSPDPRCNVKVPGFRSGRITLGNFNNISDPNRYVVHFEKLLGFMNNEALPNCPKVRSKRDGELEIKCRSRKNGTVTLIQPVLVDDGGFWRTYVEDGHQDDLCMVSIVANPNPRCNVKVPGFKSLRITLSNYKENGASILYVIKPLGFLNNEALPNCRKVRSKSGNLVPAITLAWADLIPATKLA
ncbi:hypothetical protein RHSIM_Rhsim04G0025700 [Rhododendron simsii]|uniref:Uncharacterized protein n=1 Tax=Rhododendron simsii TaxID=118357 RepID=A0A834H671_RHOSS|nr:hypothetical protein RHSIM_Rhsim04G0025700 [Rhododendron simsii]